MDAQYYKCKLGGGSYVKVAVNGDVIDIGLHDYTVKFYNLDTHKKQLKDFPSAFTPISPEQWDNIIDIVKTKINR